MPDDREIEEFMRASNFIEGETMIANPTDSAHEPWVIGRLNDHDIEGAQFFLANDVNEENLLETHRILFQGSGERWGQPEETWVGKWKPIANRIGNHIPPPPNKIPNLMKKYCEIFMEMSPFEAHNELANLHSFMDGNGRMCRLVWWWKHLYDDTYVDFRSFLHSYYYEALSNQNDRSRFVKDYEKEIF